MQINQIACDHVIPLTICAQRGSRPFPLDSETPITIDVYMLSVHVVLHLVLLRSCQILYFSPQSLSWPALLIVFRCCLRSMQELPSPREHGPVLGRPLRTTVDMKVSGI